jgi:pimeloyl-ACP methyl ester carboxylesterase
MGDGAGHGKHCRDVSFFEEVDVYVRAIKELKQRKGASTLPVYLIGHSMGGLMAPMVASKTSINGIIAYGTIGSNFIEYLLKTRRTIGEAYGWAPDETDSYIKDVCECASYYFIEKLSTAEAAAKKADCQDYLSVFDLRSRKYNDELYATNIPAVWKDYQGKALLAWGTSDFISAKEDHQIIEETVNYYHKGNASVVYISNADHGMNSAASFKEARTNPGPYNKEVAAVFLSWLKKQSS